MMYMLQGYNPNYNPYYYGNSYMQQPVNRQQIVTVNGIEGAKTYNMLAPNSSVLLLDVNEPLLYLAQTDGAGYKTITTYKIEAYTPESKIDNSDLESRIKKLEEMIYNGKSNHSEVRTENTAESDNSASNGNRSKRKPDAVAE